MSDGFLTRRGFLGAVAAGGLGLALPRCGRPVARPPRPVGRRVWLFSDVHAPLVEDGRAGAEWLERAVADLRENVQDAACAICLGDMTHQAAPEGLEAYAEVRDGSHFGRWYELAGNHDYGAVEQESYAAHVKTPLRAMVLDGNTAWFLVSTESAESAGFISQESADWLVRGIRRHQADRNIIVCTHHLVHGTVAFSTHEPRYLHPRERVEAVLAEARVDLWVSGHAHSAPREPDCSAVRGRTTYVNVASLHHAYGTGVSNSFLLELTPGSEHVRLRCRDHDRHAYLAAHEVRVTLPRAVVLGQPSEPMTETGPAVAAAGCQSRR